MPLLNSVLRPHFVMTARLHQSVMYVLFQFFSLWIESCEWAVGLVKFRLQSGQVCDRGSIGRSPRGNFRSGLFTLVLKVRGADGHDIVLHSTSGFSVNLQVNVVYRRE